MKQAYLFILVLFITNCYAESSYFFPDMGHPNETVAQARARFDCMTARQMYNLPVHQLTANQQQAFKELAREYFTSEIACPDCSSQANRRKYEIMYQKIGQLDYNCRAG